MPDEPTPSPTPSPIAPPPPTTIPRSGWRQTILRGLGYLVIVALGFGGYYAVRLLGNRTPAPVKTAVASPSIQPVRPGILADIPSLNAVATPFAPSTDQAATQPLTNYYSDFFHCTFQYPSTWQRVDARDENNRPMIRLLLSSQVNTSAALSIAVSQYTPPMGDSSYLLAYLGTWLQQNPRYSAVSPYSVGGQAGYRAQTNGTTEYFIPIDENLVVEVSDSIENPASEKVIGSFNFAP